MNTLSYDGYCMIILRDTLIINEVLLSQCTVINLLHNLLNEDARKYLNSGNKCSSFRMLIARKGFIQFFRLITVPPVGAVIFYSFSISTF